MLNIDFNKDTEEDLLASVVAAAKKQLNADISFLAEFQADMQVTRRRAYEGHSCPMEEGDHVPFRNTYCHRLLYGQIANVVNDARNHPVVKDMAVTQALDIGSYIGMPVVLSDGSIYGTLCCVSHSPTELDDQDVRLLSVLADIVSTHISRLHERDEAQLLKRRRIQHVLNHEPPKMVYQPIVDLTTGEIVGAESLARFHTEPVRSPDKWFNEAWKVGLGEELEICALRAAVANLGRLPDRTYLSVNLSPQTMLSSAFMKTACRLDLNRIVFEVTEHALVSDYEPLCAVIAQLQKMGARLAIDDVGAGYSGLSHILQLRPHILKLDLQLIANIDRDAAKQALVSAVATFASRTGVVVVAEGIETAREVDALRVLGIPFGQGYRFAKPSPLPLRLDVPSNSWPLHSITPALANYPNRANSTQALKP